MLFLYRYAEGFSSDLISYLFGSVSAVSRQDLWIVMAIAIIVILFLSLFFKELFVLSFDEEYAKASGLPAKWIHILFMIVTALSNCGIDANCWDFTCFFFNDLASSCCDAYCEKF